jgi:hypothetical protein
MHEHCLRPLGQLFVRHHIVIHSRINHTPPHLQPYICFFVQEGQVVFVDEIEVNELAIRLVL